MIFCDCLFCSVTRLRRIGTSSLPMVRFVRYLSEMCSEQDVWNAVRVLYLVPVTSYHVVTTFLRDITWRQGCLGIVLYVVYMGYVNEAINSKRHLNDVHLLKYASIRSWALFSYTCRTFKVEVKLLRMNVCVVRWKTIHTE